MSARGDRRLQTALRDLSSALTTTGAPWMIIGGIAVIARGVRRFTADIDAAIRGDEIQVRALIAALAKKRIVPRIADAERFASANLVLLLRHKPSGVDFDVSFAWTAFEHEAIAAATVAAFGTVKAPMARPEDLIVFKAIAGRGKDMDDVAALLVLYPKLDLMRVRARLRELAVLADAPEILTSLETAIAASAKVIPTSKRPSSARRSTPARSRPSRVNEPLKAASRATAKKSPRARPAAKRRRPSPAQR